MNMREPSLCGDETPEVLTTRLLLNSATEVDDIGVAGLTWCEMALRSIWHKGQLHPDAGIIPG